MIVCIVRFEFQRERLHNNYEVISVFEGLLNDKVEIHTQDEKIYNDVVVSVQRNKILTFRVDIPIRVGDQVIRKLPSGIEEVYLVEDPGFITGIQGIPDSYQMTVRRADAASRRTGPVIYNVNGANARFNVNSIDASTNIVNQSSDQLFESLKLLVQSKISIKEDQKSLLEKVDELKDSVGKPTFAKRYAEFMAVAADHVQVLSPFLPALIQLLTSSSGG